MQCVNDGISRTYQNCGNKLTSVKMLGFIRAFVKFRETWWWWTFQICFKFSTDSKLLTRGMCVTGLQGRSEVPLKSPWYNLVIEVCVVECLLLAFKIHSASHNNNDDDNAGSEILQSWAIIGKKLTRIIYFVTVIMCPQNCQM